MNALRSTCQVCGEPLVRMESPFDGIWRWRHELLGVIRTHVAAPSGPDHANETNRSER